MCGFYVRNNTLYNGVHTKCSFSTSAARPPLESRTCSMHLHVHVRLRVRIKMFECVFACVLAFCVVRALHVYAIFACSTWKHHLTGAGTALCCRSSCPHGTHSHTYWHAHMSGSRALMAENSNGQPEPFGTQARQQPDFME